MGRVERMLLHYCKNDGWTIEDGQTRMRCDGLDSNAKLWRCFYKRQPDAMLEAKEWSRTVSRMLAQIKAEDDALVAFNAIETVLQNNAPITHQ